MAAPDPPERGSTDWPTGALRLTPPSSSLGAGSRPSASAWSARRTSSRPPCSATRSPRRASRVSGSGSRSGSRDRPARALARVRREARLRGPAHLRRRCRTRRIPAELAGCRRRDRRRADRRPRLRPARRPLRPARDPRGQLPARGRTSRSKDRRFRGAEDRRLRRRAGASRPIAAASHAAIDELVGQVLDAGALPIVLGGDHSIAEPDVRAVAARARPGRPRPLRHPHRHRPRGLRRRGLARDADVPARRGRASRRRKRYVQIGLRGYWPGRSEFVWQAEQRDHELLHARRARASGSDAVVERTLELVGDGPGLPLGRRRRARSRPSRRAPGRPSRAG